MKKRERQKIGDNLMYNKDERIKQLLKEQTTEHKNRTQRRKEQRERNKIKKVIMF